MGRSDIHDDIDESLNIECRTVEMAEQCVGVVGIYNFTILTCNIRSIHANFDKLLTALKRLNIEYDVIVLTECWIREDAHMPQLYNNNIFHTTKVFNKCSGVAIYVKNCWLATATEPTFDEANCLVVKLSNCVSVIGIYRSPALPPTENFFASLESVLDPLDRTKTLIVTGDMNINLLDETLDSPCAVYKDLMAEHCLLPAITMPTREKACLDHIYLKSNCRAVGVVTDCPLTDHNLIMLGLNIKKTKSNSKVRVKSKTDFEAVARELDGYNWDQLMQMDNVNEATKALNQIISESTQKFTQSAAISRKKVVLKPWITPGLIRCMRHRDRLHLLAKQQPNNDTLKITFTRYKNYCNNIIRKTKTNFDNAQLSENHKEPKKLWRTIKDICDIPGNKNHSQALLQKYKCPYSAVNDCNQHFASKGSILASDILRRFNVTEQELCHNQKLGTHLPNSFFLSPTDLLEMDSLFKTLRSDSTPGIDLFSSRLLKNIGKSILVPMVHICNLSMTTGMFPKAWKTAVVSPIHKSGSKDCVDNYRPISLLCILSKILEKIVNKRLVDFLEKHELLENSQFGFRRGKSTEDAVQLLTETVSKQLDNGKRCVGVFLDLARAFDTVSIPILLKKLECLGVRGNALDWFSSYLSNRKQQVRIGNYISDKLDVHFGVPQGGILSPTLFVIYMNDLLKLKIPNATLICYADDTVAIFHGTGWNNTIAAAEHGMSSIARWLNANLLTLNVTKTNFIGFHITRATELKLKYIKVHSDNCTLSTTYSQRRGESCQCSNVTRVTHTKYLGIQIDQKLSFEHHISYLSKRVRKIIHVMKKLRPIANVEVKRLVYTSLCQSVIQYCISVWGGAASGNMIAAERAQRAVLKVMLGKPRRHPTEELYQEAKVLSVRQLFIMRAIAITHTAARPEFQYSNRKARSAFTPLPKVRTVFMCRLPPFIHAFTYNSVCKHCDLKEMSHRKARGKAKAWLLSLSYKATEELVKVHDFNS